MKPDWEKFGMKIMTYWPHGDVDGFALQDIAVECGVLVEEPDGFDPNRHIDTECTDAVRGDPWFVKTFNE